MNKLKCFTLAAILLAAALSGGCAAKRSLMPEPVSVSPPRIDPIAAARNDDVRMSSLAPVAFRTGVQSRQCAGAS